MHKLKSDNDTRPLPFSVHFTEVIDPDDQRASKFDEEKQKEIGGLQNVKMDNSMQK